jgi:hypothetical protein
MHFAPPSTRINSNRQIWREFQIITHFSKLIYTLVNFKLYSKASFTPVLNVYCGPLLKSLPCTSHNAGGGMVWNIGPVTEYEARSAIIPFIGIIIRKEHDL